MRVDDVSGNVFTALVGGDVAGATRARQQRGPPGRGLQRSVRGVLSRILNGGSTVADAGDDVRRVYGGGNRGG